MTLTEEQVKWVVAEVVRRLRLADTELNMPLAASGTDLRIAERVVTMRTIEAQLSGVKRLLVPPRAVVTPAVKDELKQKKIELIFEN